MKMQRPWIVLLVVLTLGLGSYLVASASQAQAAKPTAVAVLDVQEVLNNLKEREAVKADLQTRTERLKQVEQEKQKELEQLKEDLGMLKAGNPAFQAKQEEAERKLMELQVWREIEARKMAGEQTVQLERLYRKLAEAAGRVGQQNGFDLVLFKEPELDLRRADPKEIGGMIAGRKVIWAAKSLDLTEQVITLLNNEFVNQTK